MNKVKSKHIKVKDEEGFFKVLLGILWNKDEETVDVLDGIEMSPEDKKVLMAAQKRADAIVKPTTDGVTLKKESKLKVQNLQKQRVQTANKEKKEQEVQEKFDRERE